MVRWWELHPWTCLRAHPRNWLHLLCHLVCAASRSEGATPNNAPLSNNTNAISKGDQKTLAMKISGEASSKPNRPSMQHQIAHKTSGASRHQNQSDRNSNGISRGKPSAAGKR